jgi:hypothetical protein
MSEMLKWFETGHYVADTTRQREVFGGVPIADEAITKMIRNLGHAIAS